MSLKDELKRQYEKGVYDREKQYNNDIYSEKITNKVNKYKKMIDNNNSKMKQLAYDGQESILLDAHYAQYISECTDLEKVVKRLDEEKYNGLTFMYEYNMPPSCIARIKW